MGHLHSGRAYPSNGKVLYATDELTGFLAACAYVRPSRSILDLEVKSVKKKWSSSAFAAGVRRDVIEKGAQMLDISLDELIGETILALRSVASEIGLKGTLDCKGFYNYFIYNI